MSSSKNKTYKNVQFLKEGKKQVVSLSKKNGKWNIKTEKGGKADNLLLIPAFVDMHAVLGEPGNDLAESLTSFTKAAKVGGFASVLAFPNEHRDLFNKEDVLSINSSRYPKIQPVVNAFSNGKMTNLFELGKAGAKVSFISKALDAGETQRVHQYINNFGGLLVNTPNDESYRARAEVAETPVTTSLGYHGSPDMAEYSVVQRDIEIANYNCAPIHFTGISTAQSLEAIKNAKKRGVAVTCDVSIFSLCYTDEDLKSYDSNLKLKPFLRSKQHQDALFQGLKDGVIDAISSYHTPETLENKVCEFSYAAFGSISFQTFLPMLAKFVSPKIGWEKVVELTSINPSRILKEEGSKSYILIDLEKDWTYNHKSNLSLAQNSPCFNQVLKGEVIEIV